MRHRFRLVGIVFILALGSGGCVNNPDVINPAEVVFDLAELIETMIDNRVDVELVGEIQEPLFRTGGALITINDQSVEIYEFIGPGTTIVESLSVSKDGNTIGDRQIDWPATPHFYRKGRVIAFYLGENDEVLAILKFFMGPQFAGG